MSFSKLDIVKFVASGVVGLGTGKIVGKIVKAHVTPDTIIDKVTVVAAAWAVGGVVTQASKKYTNEAIDDLVAAATKVAKDIKDTTKLNRVNNSKSTFEEEGLDSKDFERNAKGEWRPVKKSAAQQLDEKLMRINRGESTFEKEGLVRTGFYQASDGYWSPIIFSE